MRSPSGQGPRALYELPAPIAPLNAVRGTILALDWRALREASVFEPYKAALEPTLREALLSATAGSWVPVDLVLAHYRALDALHLDEARAHQVGWSVGNGAHGAFLLTLIRLAGVLGVSPWSALEQSYKLWVRSWRGGAIAVHRLGDRLAEVSLRQVGVCGSHFFRASFAGALCAGIAPFCEAPSAGEVAPARDSVDYRVTWR
ncbi:MAG: hypothetical protein ABW352_19800 [Polyangiales bacterium]